MARTFIQFRRDDQLRPIDLVARASELAIEGHKLAMYDRETGLLAPWFIDMRCTEECYRAVRYKRPLTLVLLQPEAGANSDKVVKEVADLLIGERRRSDLAAYLGNGQIAILMPETDQSAAHGAIARLCRFVGRVDAGVSSYPNDGGNFEQLKAAAAGQLAGVKLAA